MCEYKHKEAYCLMIYKCRFCTHAEKIWNSRDGVTPFETSCPSCNKTSMAHTYFSLDECVPNYKLNKFQKYWRDGTEAEARSSLQRRLESMKGTKYERTDEEAKELIEEILAKGDEFQKGWPMLGIYLGD